MNRNIFQNKRDFFSEGKIKLELNLISQGKITIVLTN